MSRVVLVDPVVEELRARLAGIDRSLVLTLRAREQAQRRLLEYKRLAAMSLFDVEQERLVRDRGRGWAEECGADPDLVEEVLGRAVASGKRRFADPTIPPGNGSSPVVVFLSSPVREPDPPAGKATPTLTHSRAL